MSIRFWYSDPYSLRRAVEQLASKPGAISPREREQAIPVDVYQDGPKWRAK